VNLLLQSKETLARSGSQFLTETVVPLRKNRFSFFPQRGAPLVAFPGIFFSEVCGRYQVVHPLQGLSFQLSPTRRSPFPNDDILNFPFCSRPCSARSFESYQVNERYFFWFCGLVSPPPSSEPPFPTPIVYPSLFSPPSS